MRQEIVQNMYFMHTIRIISTHVHLFYQLKQIKPRGIVVIQITYCWFISVILYTHACNIRYKYEFEYKVNVYEC